MSDKNPADPALWARVKGEAKKKFDAFPSQNAGAWMASEYTKRGGTYSSASKESSTGMARKMGSWSLVVIDDAPDSSPLIESYHATQAEAEDAMNDAAARNGETTQWLGMEGQYGFSGSTTRAYITEDEDGMSSMGKRNTGGRRRTSSLGKDEQFVYDVMRGVVTDYANDDNFFDYSHDLELTAVSGYTLDRMSEDLKDTALTVDGDLTSYLKSKVNLSAVDWDSIAEENLRVLGSRTAQRTTTPKEASKGMSTTRRTPQQRNAAAQQRQALIQTVSAQQEALEDMHTQNRAIMALARRAEARSVLATRALADVLKMTGVATHPRFARLVAIAADEENNPVAMSANETLEKATRADVNSYGAVDGANDYVTPAAVTDVSTTNVTLAPEPFNSLVDVNAAMPNIDVPSVADAHVNTDVRAGVPSQDVAFADTNGTGFHASRRQAENQTPNAFDGSWADNADASSTDTGSETQTADYADGGDSDKKEARFVAAMRLVEARKAAGLLEATESTVVHTQTLISSTASVRDMDVEVGVLSRMASRPAARPVPRNLVPTRQAARQAPSLQSSPAPYLPNNGSGANMDDSFGLE